MKAVKILHVSTLYDCYGVGGLEFAVKKIAEAQARMGYEVGVLTRDCKSRPAYEELNNVKIYRIKSFSVFYPYLTFPIKSFDKILNEFEIIHGWGG